MAKEARRPHTETPNAAAYNGLHGELQIDGRVGDIVQLTVKNKMPEAANGEALSTGFYAPADNLQTIHWHGMELDNESDGTPVTELGIEPGEERLYRFRLYRPGNYWFHPQVLPLLTASRGQVGKLVVSSSEEDILTSIGVLPLDKTYVQLHDSTVANETNKTVYRNGVLFQKFTNDKVVDNLMPDISPDLRSPMGRPSLFPSCGPSSHTTRASLMAARAISRELPMLRWAARWGGGSSTAPSCTKRARV